jgi:PREDICTED: similar to sarco(endo)plasmic reticulum-type calcium ATPase
LKFFIVKNASADDCELNEFEVTGSTYEPLGDVFIKGQRAKCSDFDALYEFATICIMCNDSSIDFNEFKQSFEKVGEATETALIVLAEKINPWGFNKHGLNRRDTALVVSNNIQSMWRKDFTLEFSRDRKSMSSYCIPKKSVRNSNGPKLFVKGAPEGVLDRCSYVRVGDKRVPLTENMKNRILETTRHYGTGRDTLRCLALAVVDNPPDPKEMDLGDSTKFSTYEVKLNNYILTLQIFLVNYT